MRLSGKVAIVSGATKGIGRVIAAVMAAEGAKVVLVGRTVERGERFASDIRDAGGEAMFVRTDIGDEQSVRAAIDATIERYGTLTTLVNNAASTDLVNGDDGTVADVTIEGWDRILHVTLTGTLLMCKYAIPRIIDAGGGAIVNISSEGSRRPPPGMAAYCAAKAAMNSLTRSIATEYGESGIRANAILTGMVLPPDARTKFEAHPVLGPKLRAQHLTRPGRREDIAAAAVFLASDEAAFVTGIEMPVEGGMLIKTNLLTKEEIFDAKF